MSGHGTSHMLRSANQSEMLTVCQPSEVLVTGGISWTDSPASTPPHASPAGSSAKPASEAPNPYAAIVAREIAEGNPAAATVTSVAPNPYAVILAQQSAGQDAARNYSIGTVSGAGGTGGHQSLNRWSHLPHLQDACATTCPFTIPSRLFCSRTSALDS